jgi:hypothetical protein
MRAAPSVIEFAKALAKHWKGSMSGGASIIAGLGASGLGWSNWQTWVWGAATAFVIGAYFVWADERRSVIALDKTEQHENVRLRLAQLRNLGVGIRNEASNGVLMAAQWPQWWDKTVAWNAEVIETIKRISPADAEWFSVMDIMQPARVGLPIHESVDAGNVVGAFQLHDERLVRLGQLITGEKGKVCQ